VKSEPDIIDFANVLAERDRLLAQLTETQTECTRLLLENRELRAALGSISIAR
jgi:regulator of replication initiation timing